MMTLGELIETLRAAPRTKVIPHGFGNPHSFRGDYSHLAFEPRENVTVAEMLRAAESAMGKSFQGYKGGDYWMDHYTPVWLSEYGSSDGESIGPRLLQYMLKE